MNKIRLGIVGTGMAWERLHRPALRELADYYEVVAMADLNRSRVEKAAREQNLDLSKAYTNYDQMVHLPEVQAVLVLTPIPLNYSAAEAAARAGKDVICEKPMAASMDEAKEAALLPRQYGVKVMIAENYRYEEENNIIRDLIRQGRIGEPIYFIMNHASDFPSEMTENTYAATEWRQHPDYPGGAFLDAALHELAAMRHVFGAVDRVQAFGLRQNQEFNPYISVNVNMQFQNGIIGQYAYFPNGKDVQRPLTGWRIFGTKGQIYLEERQCGTINVFYADGHSEQIPYRPMRGYVNELLNFYNHVQGSEPIEVTPEIEYGDVRMVFAILRSISSESIERVDPVRFFAGQAALPPITAADWAEKPIVYQ